MEPTTAQLSNRLKALGSSGQQQIANSNPALFDSMATAAGWSTSATAPKTPPPVAADAMRTAATPLNLPQPITPQPTAPVQFDPTAIQARTEQIAGVKQGAHEGDIANLDAQLAALGFNTQNKADVRAAQEAKYGVDQYRAKVNDLFAQSLDLTAQYENVPTNVRQEGTATGQLTGFIDARVRGIQDRIASKQRLVNAQLLAAQGAMTAATSAANQAVDDYFADVTFRQANLKDQRQRILDAAARDELKLSHAETLAIKEQERKQTVVDQAIADQKEQMKGVEQLKLKLVEYGQDPNILAKTTTVNEAINIAGTRLRDPKAVLELKAMKVDMALKDAQRRHLEAQTNTIGKPTVAERKAATEQQKQTASMIPVMQDKIVNATNLMAMPGKAVRVGPSRLAREGYLIGIPGIGGFGSSPSAMMAEATGEGQAFAATVHKTVAGLTLDNLISSKERGATFGALSEGELNMLAKSATALSDWEIKDKNGHGTGYWDIDEASFDGEIQGIIALTTKALAAKGESTWTPDEKQLFDQLDSLTDITTPDQFYQ